MSIETQVREAIVAELGRQAEASEGRLSCQETPSGGMRIEGPIDLEPLVAVIVTSVAGGP